MATPRAMNHRQPQPQMTEEAKGSKGKAMQREIFWGVAGGSLREMKQSSSPFISGGPEDELSASYMLASTRPLSYIPSPNFSS